MINIEFIKLGGAGEDNPPHTINFSSADIANITVIDY